MTLDPLFLSLQSALAGRYSLDREIGRGGMGVVYLAKEVHLDRPVAIKLLPPQHARDPVLRERFVREARLAAKLSHPHIIPIHSVDEVGDFVFYVMTYIDGETLTARVTQRGPLSASEGTRVLREVAWALAHAHEHGVVHRDVKPDNILLERTTNRAMVADFGIAAAIADAASERVSGTPEFMSPEQALGKDVDTRSDLYSLAATAYFAFSGRIPFEGASSTEIIAKHVTAMPEPIGSIGVTVPRRVALLIDRCLAKDPDRRPETAMVVADSLSAALEQKRELPVALRAFVRKDGRLGGMGTLIFPLGALLSAGGLGWFTYDVLGLVVPDWTLWAYLALLHTVAPLVALGRDAKRLIRQGFSHQDLEPAFRSEAELAREERAVERGRDATSAERFFRLTAGTVAAGSVAAIGVQVWTLLFVDSLRGALQRVLDVAPSTWWLLGAGVLAVISAGLHVTAEQMRRDVDTEFWGRVWTGRIGRALFAVAKRFTRADSVNSAATHRPTELSLSLAVDALYESLPRATRDGIGDVPAIVHALERDAHLMRARLNELRDGLAAINEVNDSAQYAAVQTDRDRAEQRLRAIVGAMETIRLNLLRLHAGSGTIESFTTNLGALAAGPLLTPA